jgi:hypothetical protein
MADNFFFNSYKDCSPDLIPTESVKAVAKEGQALRQMRPE